MNSTNIIELFDKWKKEHKSDQNFSGNCTLKGEKAKGNFVLDGRFDNNKKDGGILFICKESNVEVDTTYGEKEFWLKKVVEAKSSNPPQYYNAKTVIDKRAQTKYYNCLCHIIDKLNNELKTNYDIKDCAYMNINKRGGTSVANNKKIINYFNQYYSKYIRNEIVLLNCDYIVVFCYEQFEESIVKELRNINGYTDKIYGYEKHPSRYSKKCEPKKL